MNIYFCEKLIFNTQTSFSLYNRHILQSSFEDDDLQKHVCEILKTVISDVEGENIREAAQRDNLALPWLPSKHLLFLSFSLVTEPSFILGIDPPPDAVFHQ